MQKQSSVSLVPFSSFHSSSTADVLYTVNSLEDVLELYAGGVFQKKNYILGKGCNTLFNGDFDGVIIHNKILGIDIISEDSTHIELKVGAGEDWIEFVQYCVAHSYAGVENLSEIPGTVGASPVQNIGAYGAEVADVIEKVEGIDLLTGEKKIFKKDACAFGYRTSIFKTDLKNKFFITAVYFCLKKYTPMYVFNVDYADIQNYISDHTIAIDVLSLQIISEIITHIRNSKLPSLEQRGTAGSFFKNPIVSLETYNKLLEQFPELKSYSVTKDTVKIPAAQLIEMVGLKGIMEDGVGIYSHHALILVSEGVQKGEKIVAFASKVQDKVKEKFGIDLEPEVNIIG